MRFVVDRVHWDKFFFLSGCFGFPFECHLVRSAVLIFILILPLSERQAGEAWEPADMAVLGFAGQRVFLVAFRGLNCISE